jgi:hypothetical protein
MENLNQVLVYRTKRILSIADCSVNARDETFKIQTEIFKNLNFYKKF